MLFNLWTDEVLSCDYIILQTEITMVKGNKIKTIFLNVNDCCYPIKNSNIPHMNQSQNGLHLQLSYSSLISK
jgi:hypothetical protein